MPKPRSNPTPTPRSRFRFGDSIGSGGMGAVRHAARLDENGEVVDDRLAVKHLSDGLLASPEAVRRFKREVRLQRRLDHPNVMPVLGRNLSASPPWFTMPLADASLAQDIRERGKRDLPWVVSAARQILAGVAHAHDHDVVHRDLKPPNVLRLGDVLKVADFGLGKDLQEDATHLTRTNQRMGTSAYMAPEQFDDPKSVGKPADVYAIGKIVCELSTGRRPPVRAVDLDGVDRDLHYFVTRCCDPDPARRYADAREALDALGLLLDDEDGDPQQVAETLIRRAHEALLGGEIAAQALADLTEHFARNADEEELYLEVLPSMPVEVLAKLEEHDSSGFARLVEAFDGHIDGSLPFAYCDEVAILYRAVWHQTNDLAVRELVLRRLIIMGASHNRWFVRDVVCSLLAGISDRATEMMAADVIKGEPVEAAWHAEEALASKPPRAVAKALKGASR